MFAWMQRRRNQRRRYSFCKPAVIECLERRDLLAATVISEIADADLNGQTLSVTLSDHFDDIAIDGSTVEVVTPLGTIYLETFDTVTPNTVSNFLTLASSGAYEDMFFHRSATGFVVQGGGYTYPEGATQVGVVESLGNVVNEFGNWFDPEIGGLSAGSPLNVRGTLAMAKLGGDPDSATTQWFFNLSDNSSNLDGQNGGFTVFAQVLFNGMDVVDSIAALQRVNAGSPFDTLPVRDYVSGTILRDNLVTTSVNPVDELSFEVTGNSNTAAITATIVSGVLEVSAVEGQSGVADVTVTATDLQGNQVSSTFQVTTSEVPGSSAVTGPADGANPQPTITWTAATNAASYELWVNHIDVQNAVIHETAVTTTSFTPASDLVEGIYRVWVRPRSASGLTGEWSAAHTFVVGAPRPEAVTITSPSESLVTDRRPLIEWTASAGATVYDLWVNQVGGQSQVIRSTDLAETSFTPTADLEYGIYRAWVRAGNVAGNSSWSVAATFEVIDASVPKITAPKGNGVASRPTIDWTATAANTTYELWVNQIGGTNRIIHETTLTATTFTPDTDLADGSYRAWVRELPSGSAPGAWSDAFEFTVGQDTTPGTTNITEVTATDTARPFFAWSAAANASRYELWVNVVGGTPRVVHVTDIQTTQFTALSDLATGAYRTWIRAFNSDNVAGSWSAAFDFVLT